MIAFTVSTLLALGLQVGVPSSGSDEVERQLGQKVARLAETMRDVEMWYYRWAQSDSGKIYGLTYHRFRKSGYRYEVASWHAEGALKKVQAVLEGPDPDLRGLLQKLVAAHRTQASKKPPFFVHMSDGRRMTAWSNVAGRGHWTGKYCQEHSYFYIVPNLMTLHGNTGLGKDAYCSWIWRPEVLRDITASVEGDRTAMVQRMKNGKVLQREMTLTFGEGISADRAVWQFVTGAGGRGEYVARKAVELASSEGLEAAYLATVKAAKPGAHTEYYSVVGTAALSEDMRQSMKTLEIDAPPAGQPVKTKHFFDGITLQGPSTDPAGEFAEREDQESIVEAGPADVMVTLGIFALGLVLLRLGLRNLRRPARASA